MNENEIVTTVHNYYNDYTNTMTKRYECVVLHTTCNFLLDGKYERIEVDEMGNFKSYWTFSSEIDYENWLDELAIERRNKKIDKLLND